MKTEDEIIRDVGAKIAQGHATVFHVPDWDTADRYVTRIAAELGGRETDRRLEGDMVRVIIVPPDRDGVRFEAASAADCSAR